MSIEKNGLILPGEPEFVRNPHGAYIVDGQEVAYTMQCPHCGKHFVSIKGSGARRTFCLKCHAITCGDFACDHCKPFEKQLEEIERATKGLAISSKG